MTRQMARFALEYLKDFNGRRSAIAVGVKPSGAGSTARDWLAHREVRGFIDAEQEALKAECRVEILDIVRRYLDIVESDVNELVQHRRVCCRHCYTFGLGEKRTPSEMRAAKAFWDQRVTEVLADPRKPAVGPFDPAGGDDFDPTLDPDPDCVECFGKGHTEVWMADTRDLSRTGRALYAGVKTTKNGTEMLMHSKEKALEMLGRHLGMFTDVIEINDPNDLSARILASRRRTGG